MKAFFLAILAVTIASVICENVSQKEQDMIKACQSELNASDDDANTLIQLKTPKSDGAKALAKCTLLKADLMDDEGNLKNDNLVQYMENKLENDALKESKAKDMAEKCKNVKGKDATDKAAKIVNDIMGM